RTLEAIGYIEDFGNDLEAVSNVKWSADDTRIVAESCAKHLPQIALLGLCRNARGGSRALAIDHYDWSLHHRRHAEPFAHEGEPATRGCAHGANAGMGGADRHVHHSNFVFHLPNHNPCLTRMGRHPVQNTGGWTHRISTVELHPGGDAAHRKGHVPA